MYVRTSDCWHAEWRSRQSCLDHISTMALMHVYKPFMENAQDDLSFTIKRQIGLLQ
jgi:hypothetical protein